MRGRYYLPIFLLNRIPDYEYVAMVTLNPLLSILDVRPSDRVISIKENGNIDANFILTHVIKQVFTDNHKVCLVLLHNALGHYQSVGKRLGYDILKQTAENNMKPIEILKEIEEEIGNEPNYLNDDKQVVIKHLFERISSTIEELSRTGKVYLIIDDVSHLLDLGIDLQNAIDFVNCCISLSSEKIVVVMNTHVTTKFDKIICNNLDYASDIVIEVAPLKTGMSREVTGLLKVERAGGKVSQFHYKTFDRGVKTFHMGESLYNLYK